MSYRTRGLPCRGRHDEYGGLQVSVNLVRAQEEAVVNYLVLARTSTGSCTRIRPRRDRIGTQKNGAPSCVASRAQVLLKDLRGLGVEGKDFFEAGFKLWELAALNFTLKEVEGSEYKDSDGFHLWATSRRQSARRDARRARREAEAAFVKKLDEKLAKNLRPLTTCSRTWPSTRKCRVGRPLLAPGAVKYLNRQPRSQNGGTGRAPLAEQVERDPTERDRRPK